MIRVKVNTCNYRYRNLKEYFDSISTFILASISYPLIFKLPVRASSGIELKGIMGETRRFPCRND